MYSEHKAVIHQHCLLSY